MYCRLFRAQCREFIRVVVGDFPCIEGAHPVGDLLRSRESGFHRYLLVEQYTYEKGERILIQQRISCRITG